jgi:hypothetical protein
MAITVYWTNRDPNWLRAEEPVSIYKNFVKTEVAQNINVNFCPSVKLYLKNMYGLKSIHEYSFDITEPDGSVISNLYDQDFFNNHVTIRSIEDRAFSFNQPFLFFTEESSLELSIGIFPSFENNFITQNTAVIPGTMDIGKWFRPIDFAFYLKNDQKSFHIKEGDIFQYIQFNTKEKIVFKQFMINDKLSACIDSVLKGKQNRPIKKLGNLEEYYNMMKNKKMIIREIKDNLIG